MRATSARGALSANSSRAGDTAGSTVLTASRSCHAGASSSQTATTSGCSSGRAGEREPAHTRVSPNLAPRTANRPVDRLARRVLRCSRPPATSQWLHHGRGGGAPRRHGVPDGRVRRGLPPLRRRARCGSHAPRRLASRTGLAARPPDALMPRCRAACAVHAPRAPTPLPKPSRRALRLAPPDQEAHDQRRNHR